jgi:hypothetical protein
VLIQTSLSGDWSRRRVRGDKLGNAVRVLGAVADPVCDAVMLEQDTGRVGTGIVGSDNLDGAAVAGAVLLNDNDAIVGLLAGANARQTNHNHGVFPFKKTAQKICLLALIKGLFFSRNFNPGG